jgi:hypothetical protein
MTYSSGGLIQAADYNTFATNLDAVWSTGTGNSGWGQTSIASVAASGIVTATNWATLVNNLSFTGAQSTTTITSRTPPVTGNIVAILANVATDITNCTTNRANATSSGTEYGTFTGTTSKTTGTSNGTAGAWTITFTHTVTFASANAARYFFNAGGRVRLQYGKTSTGTVEDTQWNTLAGWCGSLYLTGIAGAKTIAGVSYTGTSRIGGTGGTQTTLSTATGWYALTATPVTIFQLNNTSALYTGEYIATTATQTSTSVLTLVTTWVQPASGTAGSNTSISGGTGVTSPATTIGVATAPTTLCTYFPPSIAQGLSNTWGTPTITAAVV